MSLLIISTAISLNLCTGDQLRDILYVRQGFIETRKNIASRLASGDLINRKLALKRLTELKHLEEYKVRQMERTYACNF